MKRLAVVALALLAFAPTASAKEILGLQLCGASGCASDRGASLREDMGGGPFGAGGTPAVAPEKPGPWYRAYALAGDHGRVYGKLRFYYVPAGSTIVQPGQGAQTTTWMRASGEWKRVLDELATRVQAYAVPRITRVSLNGSNADDPQSYLRVYTIGAKATGYPSDSQSTQVVLESDQRSPWTDGNYVVLYPKARLLIRDGQLVSIADGIADRIVAGESLDTGRAFPWLPLLGGLAAVGVALAAAFALHARPRRGPVPQPQQ